MRIFDDLGRCLFENDFDRFLQLLSKKSTCWYPSAGKDFIDILYWNRLRIFGIPEPDLYIHTDCDSGISFNEGEIIYSDKETHISVAKMEEVFLYNQEVDYNVRRDYFSYVFSADPSPKVTLLEIKIESTILGTFTKPVLFFHFENYNWFEEFAIKQGLKISHMFKVREGCGFGGNLKSISSIYGLLNFIGCKYLIADQEVHFDADLAENLRNLANVRRRVIPFNLETFGKLGQIRGWNMLIHKINTLPRQQGIGWLNQVLRTITVGDCWERDQWVSEEIYQQIRR